MPQTPPGTSQGLSESRVGDADAPSTPPPVEPRLAPRPATPRRTRRTGRTVALAALALLLLGLVGLELLTRFWLRMGDPPLYMTDPQCEYLMVPSRSYDRLRAHTTYNAWSMRATPDFPKAKSDPNEKAVLKNIYNYSGFRESSNAQLIPIRQLELFKDRITLEGDTVMAAGEKQKKLAEIDAKLA